MFAKTTKSVRRQLISPRSKELARSGEFAGYRAIVRHLRFVEELPEAREQLHARSTRDHLDKLCREAQGRRRTASPPFGIRYPG